MKLICRKTCSKCRAAVKLLDERGVDYTYQEYTEEPLTADEIGWILDRIEAGPKEYFRRTDSANKALGLTGNEPRETLIAKMVEHPTLLQRPIGIVGERVILGRPPENLLQLLD